MHKNSSKLISDDAIVKATGKNWAEWFEILDQAGVLSYSHAEIVKWIAAQNLVENFWWHQTIAGEYQKARGKRKVGEKENATFQAGTQKTFSINVKRAWEFLTNDPARSVWLGTVNDLPLVKGATFATEEGTLGEVRGIKQENYIRLQLQEAGSEDPRTLVVYLMPTGEKTAIRFLHEKLKSQEERTAMTAHWKEVLKQFAKMLK